MSQPAAQSSSNPFSQKQSWHNFHELLTVFGAEAEPLYLVGGAVRDLWLSAQNGQPRPLADLDLLVPADALSTARRVADKIGWAYFPLDAERDVARLVKSQGTQQLVCDVSTPRGGSLQSDLKLRDFTINAMALRLDQAGVEQFAHVHTTANPWSAAALQERTIDPFGGRADLVARTVRTVTPQSFIDDPMRLVRAVRFAIQLGFTLDSGTRRQVEELAHLVAQCSAERVRDELWKATVTQAPAAAVRAFDQMGLLSHLLPEVSATKGVSQSAPHHLDVYEHTLRTVEHATRLRNWLKGERNDTPNDYTKTNAEYIIGQEWRAALAPWRTQLVAHFSHQTSAGRNRAQWLVWYALLHDVGKPETRTLEMNAELGAAGQARIRFLGHETVGAKLAAKRLEALRFSRDEITLCATVVQAHMHPHWLHASFGDQPLSRRVMFRFFRKTGGMNTDAMPAIDVLLLAMADYMAIHKGLNGALENRALSEWRQYLNHIVQYMAFAFAEDGPKQVQQQPLVNGHILMQQLGISPGPQLGRLLEQVAEAQVAGEISTAAEAVEWTARLLQSSP